MPPAIFLKESVFTLFCKKSTQTKMTMCGFLRNGGKGNEKKNNAESKIMLIIM